MTTWLPGASEVFTHGLTASPRARAFCASSPAAIITLGLEVLVQLVIAAITTSPWLSFSSLPFIGTRDLDGFSVLKMQVVVKGDLIEDVRWEGEGTKVFLASASILSSWLAGKKVEDYNKLLDLWDKMLTEVEVVDHAPYLGDVRALEYVIRNRRDRIREIALPWTAVARLMGGVTGARPPAAPLVA